MSDECDFAIDPGDLQPAAEPPADSPAAPPEDPDSNSAPATAPPPHLVVIQYRNRGLHMAFLPPLLILLAALVITSYQRQGRLRPLSPPSTTVNKADDPATPAGRRRIIMVEESATGVAVEPVQVRAATPPLLPPPPIPASLAAPASPPGPETEPIGPDEPVAMESLARAGNPLEPGPFSPFDKEATPSPTEPGAEIAVGPPLEPPVPPLTVVVENLSPDSPERAFLVVGDAAPEGPAPGVEPEPKATKEQILRGIQAEAVQKKADQENLKNEMVHAKVREYYEVFRKIHAERPAFHNDLRRLVDELGDGAGPEIASLCDRYGRDPLPEVRKLVGQALKRSAARLNRKPKIEMLRAQGVPEPMILDLLAHEQEVNINTRGGPRDRNEVLAYAARVLLAYPPAAPREKPPATKPARSSAAPRSMVGVAAPPVPRTVRPPQ